jgi:hypothetical protein
MTIWRENCARKFEAKKKSKITFEVCSLKFVLNFSMASGDFLF